MDNIKTPEYPELLAELQLATFFPEISEWNAVLESYFSRNYSFDLRDCLPNQQKVMLSRNGIYDVLPEKLFFGENILRFKDKSELSELVTKMHDEKEKIRDYLLPFDSTLFSYSFRLQKNVTQVVTNKHKLLLKHFFDYDIDAETNPYIRLLAPLLLQAKDLRGDFERLTHILTAIIDCKVEYNIEHNETVRFTIHKLKLNSAEYKEFNEVLKPFFAFFELWFLPMELNCIFKVKDYQQPFVLSDSKPLVLDYNTKLS